MGYGGLLFKRKIYSGTCKYQNCLLLLFTSELSSDNHSDHPNNLLVFLASLQQCRLNQLSYILY